MSRLDLILSIVDKLEARSNDILSTVEDSNRLINHLVSMNEEISSLDSSIEDIGDLLSDNSNNMNQFSNLYEKSFYLESNLHVNDIITSQTSFETLTNEFHHLVKRLERNDYYSRVPYVNHPQNEDSIHQNENSIHHNERDESIHKSYEVPSHMDTVYETPTHMDTAYDSTLDNITPTTFHPDTPPTVPQMHNKVSLSNLKLKPIRCNSRKVYKKKSRYRLSGIYNINPIAYEESQFLSGLDDESCASPQLATIDLFTPQDLLKPQDFTDERFTPQDFTERFTLGNFTDADQLTPDLSTFGEASAYRNIIPSSETPAYRHIIPSISDHTNISSNIMHNEDPIDNDISFQPDELNSLASSPLNETAIYKRLRSNSLPEGHLVDNNNILGDFEISDPDKLRMNRLKSFISYHNIHRSFEIHPQSGDTFFSKSPPTASLNIDHNDEFDNISICSDLSYYSPAKQTPTLDVQEEFDNFDKYLRQSRIDLRNAFPDTITKASSHESIFQSEIEVLRTTKPYKFHNPAESMMLGSSKVSVATVFYDNDHSTKSKKSVSFAETQDPKKFLSEVMLRNDHTSKPSPPVMLPPESPNKFNNFSIFNFAMNSPSKPKSIPSQERRNSMDHISNSLTDTFKNLVNTTTVTHKPKKLSYPEKKKRELELKLHPISNEVRPITIKNEIHTKRLPIRIPRNDGSSSQLTIGPNNTKIINHGERSAFKRPVMTSISRNSLRDALSSSIL